MGDDTNQQGIRKKFILITIMSELYNALIIQKISF